MPVKWWRFIIADTQEEDNNERSFFSYNVVHNGRFARDVKVTNLLRYEGAKR
jgi:hypothetical protein